MSDADELLRLMFSWIRQKESCAEQMKKLAKELETIRERCNVAECCGDVLSVAGAGGLIAAGVVTLFTGGAAAPFLGVLAAACGGVGATVSVGTKLTELFLSSNTLEELQEADEMSNELAEKIEKQFERLKKEVRRTNPSADPEELDQHVMDQFMRAVARRGGIRMDNISTDSLFKALKVVGFPVTASIEGMFVGILRSVGRQMINKAAKEVAKKAASAGFKAAVKGAGKVAGGAVGMAFALPEAIDNWTDLIKNNHVTEASQSLRDNAKKLLETSQELKTQLNTMRKKCEEVVQTQRDYEATKRRQTEETDKRQKKENQQTKQTRGDSRDDGGAQRGNDRSDDEHEESSQEEEESDSEEEESDSEEETEEDESKQTGGKKKTKRGGKTTTRRTNTDQRQIPPGFISMALLNVRSLTNMTDTVRRLITQNQLDVFLTTETWLRPDTAERVLTQASPPNFRNFSQVREDRRGGGVAIQFRAELQGRRVWFDNIRTFEYVAAVLRRDDWNQKLLIINLYLPPGYDKEEFKDFLREFEELMEEATKKYSSIIMTGDFNIKVDPQRWSYAHWFHYLLALYDLDLHIHEQTHRGGNILDLVLTRNVEIPMPRVDPNAGIRTDHYPIYFKVKPKPAGTREETEEDEDEEQGKQPKRREE